MHSFDSDIAQRYGIKEAIMLQHFDFWITKNSANEKHYHDGMYWTYNSIRAYQQIFPYLSKGQIERTLNNLVEEGLLAKGNYNAIGYDRTTWYALTDKYYTISRKQETHFSNLGNGVLENEKPIPVINTGNKPNNTNLNDVADNFFDKLWSMYPKKRGKSSVKPATRKKLLLVGEEEMIKAVTRYAEECKGKDPQYIMNGSTFFNGRYEDYLGNDFTPIPKSNVQSPSKPYVPEPPRYQKFEKEERIEAVPMSDEQRANMEALRRKLGAIG